MAAWLRALISLLNKTARLAYRRLGALALAVLIPFVLSHVVVLQARRIGMPERLVMDALHGVLVLAYLGAAVRVALGSAQGLARFGFAIPKPTWPGFAALARMIAAVVLIGLPAALLLHPLTHAVEDWAVQSASAWAAVPTVMVPEFVMTTLVALVVAAEIAMMPHTSNQ